MEVEAAVYGHMGSLCSRYSGGYARLPVIETHGEREQVVPVDHGQRDVLMLKRAAVLSSASFYNDRVVASFRRGCFRPDELQDRRQTLSLGHAQPLVHILRPGCVPSPVLFSSSRARSMSAMCRVAGCRVAVPYGSTRPQPAVRQRPLSRPPFDPAAIHQTARATSPYQFTDAVCPGWDVAIWIISFDSALSSLVLRARTPKRLRHAR